MIYLLTAVGLTPAGSSTVHIYTQTIHRVIQLTTFVGRLSEIRTQNGQTNWEECGPCFVFASYTLAFVLQLRKKHGKTSFSTETPQYMQYGMITCLSVSSLVNRRVCSRISGVCKS